MMARTVSTVKVAERLVTAMAKTVPFEAAAAWVHAGAVLAYVEAQGLATQGAGSDARERLRSGMAALADAHPALGALADPAVNRIWDTAPPVEFCEQITDLWAGHFQRSDRPDGYEIGDLYQHLSTEARKGRALCQTPKFVTDLLIQTTLRRSVEDYGHATVRAIDPSCGTGHIVLEMALSLWHSGRPWEYGSRDGRGWGRREWPDALDQVHGVDLDPYAAALTRLRLVIMSAGVMHSPINRLPADLPIHVAAANSLLATDEPLLKRGTYHAVLGNPPYIVVENKQLRDAIRQAYPRVCHMKYSLALPFFQLMTELTVSGGWIGQLTAMSFMKREFGRKFIEGYLPALDLRWVIDSSGVYIPGHGTPTCILVHRNAPPASDIVHTILHINGEPSVPADPAKGLVWTAIRDAVNGIEAADRCARKAPIAPGTAVAMPELTVIAPAPRTYVQPSLFDLQEAA